MFSKLDPTAFDALSLRVFNFQYAYNAIYRQWSDYLNKTPDTVKDAGSIPFIPVDLFKTLEIQCSEGNSQSAFVFESSRTSGNVPSRHFVRYLDLYERSYHEAFKLFYGPPSSWRILALLPSYLERKGSSLVYMVQGLIAASGHAESGFFLNNIDQLVSLLRAPSERPTLLIGVSFALLDLAEQYPMKLENTVVMETGGMKGRRIEPTRLELHNFLCGAFGVKQIHSEYGMTELLSQAYSKCEGRFMTPPWMKLSLRDTNDPLSAVPKGKTGGINITDLANLYSCSFIGSSDLGRETDNGMIEILGRLDFSETRGCNLMVSDL